VTFPYYSLLLLQIRDLTTLEHGISCLSFSNHSSVGGPNLLVAGSSSGGTVSLFDIRCAHSSVLSHRGHSNTHTAILDCQLQDSGGFDGYVVSGTADGTILVADPRYMTTKVSGSEGVKKAITLPLTSPLKGTPCVSVSGLAIHRRAFVAAVAAGPSVAAHSLLGTGNQISRYKIHGFNDSSSPICGSVGFHPQLLQLAMGSPDGTVAVRGLRKIE